MELILRIDWSDMDLFGHVNNIAYFRYIQSARVNFWEKTGILNDYDENGTGPILASCHCEFKSALEYPGSVIIETIVSRVGTTSFTLSHTLKNNEGIVAAIATDVIVNYSFNKKEKRLLTDEIRALLQSSF